MMWEVDTRTARTKVDRRRRARRGDRHAKGRQKKALAETDMRRRIYVSLHVPAHGTITLNN
jgi:hypothetical protein